MSDRDPETGQFTGGNNAALKYNEDYHCRKIIEFAAEGQGPAEWAAQLGVSKKTLYRWCEEFPPFDTAFTRAKTMEQSWWERMARAASFQPSADNNGSLINKQMSARFRDDYTERQELGVSGSLETQSDEQLKSRLAVLLGKAGIGVDPGGAGASSPEE